MSPKPLSLHLSEQDVLAQLPALGDWTPPTPRPEATLVELKVLPA